MKKSILINEQGGAVLEYALIVALMSIAIVLSVTALGRDLSTVFQNIAIAVQNAR